MQKEREFYLQIWAKAVETQMHFNEMSVKSRQLGLAFVAAALGVAIVLLSRGQEFTLKIPIAETDFAINVAVLIIAAAAFAIIAVRDLDLGVYHKMLRGAVSFGEDVEEKYMKKFIKLEKGMTQSISFFSRHQDAKVEMVNGQYSYVGKGEVTAYVKIQKFYKRTIRFMFFVAVFLLIVANAKFLEYVFKLAF